MREIFNLQVTQVRIFPIDRIPFDKFSSSGPQAAFKETFGWTKTTSPGAGEVVLEGGICPVKGRDPIQITRLALNNQRLELSVRGDSKAADLIFEEISRFWSSIDTSNTWKGTEPVILTHETTAIVRLKFLWRAIFSSTFADFMDRKAADHAAEAFSASAELKNFSLSFFFSIDHVSPSIAAHGVTVSPKAVTIEPRLNTPLAERIYFTNSPTDSETHLQLLNELEELLTEK